MYYIIWLVVVFLIQCHAAQQFSNYSCESMPHDFQGKWWNTYNAEDITINKRSYIVHSKAPKGPFKLTGIAVPIDSLRCLEDSVLFTALLGTTETPENSTNMIYQCVELTRTNNPDVLTVRTVIQELKIHTLVELDCHTPSSDGHRQYFEMAFSKKAFSLAITYHKCVNSSKVNTAIKIYSGYLTTFMCGRTCLAYGLVYMYFRSNQCYCGSLPEDGISMFDSQTNRTKSSFSAQPCSETAKNDVFSGYYILTKTFPAIDHLYIGCFVLDDSMVSRDINHAYLCIQFCVSKRYLYAQYTKNRCLCSNTYGHSGTPKTGCNQNCSECHSPSVGSVYSLATVLSHISICPISKFFLGKWYIPFFRGAMVEFYNNAYHAVSDRMEHNHNFFRVKGKYVQFQTVICSSKAAAKVIAVIWCKESQNAIKQCFDLYLAKDKHHMIASIKEEYASVNSIKTKIECKMDGDVTDVIFTRIPQKEEVAFGMPEAPPRKDVPFISVTPLGCAEEDVLNWYINSQAFISPGMGVDDCAHICYAQSMTVFSLFGAKYCHCGTRPFLPKFIGLLQRCPFSVSSVQQWCGDHCIKVAVYRSTSMGRPIGFEKRSGIFLGCSKVFTGENSTTGMDKSSMTIDWCLQWCKEKEYRYAGLQFQTTCICQHIWNKFDNTEDKLCSSSCNSGWGSHCGGPNGEVAIYEVLNEENDALTITKYLNLDLASFTYAQTICEIPDVTDNSTAIGTLRVKPNVQYPNSAINHRFKRYASNLSSEQDQESLMPSSISSDVFKLSEEQETILRNFEFKEPHEDVDGVYQVMIRRGVSTAIDCLPKNSVIKMRDASLSWWRGKMKPITDGRLVLLETGALEIKDAEPGDTGLYTCDVKGVNLVTNDADEVQYQHLITVFSMPILYFELKFQYNVKECDSAAESYIVDKIRTFVCDRLDCGIRNIKGSCEGPDIVKLELQVFVPSKTVLPNCSPKCTANAIISAINKELDKVRQFIQNDIDYPKPLLSYVEASDTMFFSFECEGGFYRTKSCLCFPCLPGTYATEEMDECRKCPLGTYQPGFAMDGCITCPEDTNTMVSGSTHREDCKKDDSISVSINQREIVGVLAVIGFIAVSCLMCGFLCAYCFCGNFKGSEKKGVANLNEINESLLAKSASIPKLGRIQNEVESSIHNLALMTSSLGTNHVVPPSKQSSVRVVKSNKSMNQPDDMSNFERESFVKSVLSNRSKDIKASSKHNINEIIEEKSDIATNDTLHYKSFEDEKKISSVMSELANLHSILKVSSVRQNDPLSKRTSVGEEKHVSNFDVLMSNDIPNFGKISLSEGELSHHSPSLKVLPIRTSLTPAHSKPVSKGGSSVRHKSISNNNKEDSRGLTRSNTQNSKMTRNNNASPFQSYKPQKTLAFDEKCCSNGTATKNNHGINEVYSSLMSTDTEKHPAGSYRERTMRKNKIRKAKINCSTDFHFEHRERTDSTTSTEYSSSAPDHTIFTDSSGLAFIGMSPRHTLRPSQFITSQDEQDMYTSEALCENENDQVSTGNNLDSDKETDMETSQTLINTVVPTIDNVTPPEYSTSSLSIQSTKSLSTSILHRSISKDNLMTQPNHSQQDEDDESVGTYSPSVTSLAVEDVEDTEDLDSVIFSDKGSPNLKSSSKVPVIEEPQSDNNQINNSAVTAMTSPETDGQYTLDEGSHSIINKIVIAMPSSSLHSMDDSSQNMPNAPSEVNSCIDKDDISVGSQLKKNNYVENSSSDESVETLSVQSFSETYQSHCSISDGEDFQTENEACNLNDNNDLHCTSFGISQENYLNEEYSDQANNVKYETSSSDVPFWVRFQRPESSDDPSLYSLPLQMSDSSRSDRYLHVTDLRKEGIHNSLKYSNTNFQEVSIQPMNYPYTEKIKPCIEADMQDSIPSSNYEMSSILLDTESQQMDVSEQLLDAGMHYRFHEYQNYEVSNDEYLSGYNFATNEIESQEAETDGNSIYLDKMLSKCSDIYIGIQPETSPSKCRYENSLDLQSSKPEISEGMEPCIEIFMEPESLDMHECATTMSKINSDDVLGFSQKFTEMNGGKASAEEESHKSTESHRPKRDEINSTMAIHQGYASTQPNSFRHKKNFNIEHARPSLVDNLSANTEASLADEIRQAKHGRTDYIYVSKPEMPNGASIDQEVMAQQHALDYHEVHVVVPDESTINKLAISSPSWITSYAEILKLNDPVTEDMTEDMTEVYLCDSALSNSVSDADISEATQSSDASVITRFERLSLRSESESTVVGDMSNNNNHPVSIELNTNNSASGGRSPPYNTTDESDSDSAESVYYPCESYVDEQGNSESVGDGACHLTTIVGAAISARKVNDGYGASLKEDYFAHVEVNPQDTDSNNSLVNSKGEKEEFQHEPADTSDSFYDAAAGDQNSGNDKGTLNCAASENNRSCYEIPRNAGSIEHEKDSLEMKNIFTKYKAPGSPSVFKINVPVNGCKETKIMKPRTESNIKLGSCNESLQTEKSLDDNLAYTAMGEKCCIPHIERVDLSAAELENSRKSNSFGLYATAKYFSDNFDDDISENTRDTSYSSLPFDYEYYPTNLTKSTETSTDGIKSQYISYDKNGSYLKEKQPLKRESDIAVNYKHGNSAQMWSEYLSLNNDMNGPDDEVLEKLMSLFSMDCNYNANVPVNDETRQYLKEGLTTTTVESMSPNLLDNNAAAGNRECACTPTGLSQDYPIEIVPDSGHDDAMERENKLLDHMKAQGKTKAAEFTDLGLNLDEEEIKVLPILPSSPSATTVCLTDDEDMFNKNSSNAKTGSIEKCKAVEIPEQNQIQVTSETAECKCHCHSSSSTLHFDTTSRLAPDWLQISSEEDKAGTETHRMTSRIYSGDDSAYAYYCTPSQSCSNCNKLHKHLNNSNRQDLSDTENKDYRKVYPSRRSSAPRLSRYVCVNTDNSGPTRFRRYIPVNKTSSRGTLNQHKIGKQSSDLPNRHDEMPCLDTSLPKHISKQSRKSCSSSSDDRKSCYFKPVSPAKPDYSADQVLYILRKPIPCISRNMQIAKTDEIISCQQTIDANSNESRQNSSSEHTSMTNQSL